MLRAQCPLCRVVLTGIITRWSVDHGSLDSVGCKQNQSNKRLNGNKTLHTALLLERVDFQVFACLCWYKHIAFSDVQQRTTIALRREVIWMRLHDNVDDYAHNYKLVLPYQQFEITKTIRLGDKPMQQRI